SAARHLRAGRRRRTALVGGAPEERSRNEDRNCRFHVVDDCIPRTSNPADRAGAALAFIPIMRLAIALLLIGCAGPSRAVTVASTVVFRDDEALTAALEHSLAKTARISLAAKNVRIATNGGVVVLGGSVPSKDDHRAV